MISMEKQIVDMLNKLAEKLGVASAKIWEWSLLQVKVEIIQSIILVAMTVVLIYPYCRWVVYVIKNYDEIDDNNYSIPHMLGLIIVGIALLFMSIGSAVAIYNLPQLIFNPEYSAFQNILDQLAKLR